jgi:stress response protein YsnF
MRSQERSVVSTTPVTTSELSNRQYVEPQTADISAPMEKDRLIIDDQSMDIDSSEADFNEGQVGGMEKSGETTDSEVTFGA